MLTGAQSQSRRWMMLASYRVYDLDAQVILAPAMWDLLEKYFA
jgi:hypothetical protein